MHTRMMIETANSGFSRHAKILPSFIAKKLNGPLVGISGSVFPAELVMWSRGPLLDEVERIMLRAHFAKEYRFLMNTFWDEVVGVNKPSPANMNKLSVREQSTLTTIERKANRALGKLTLREVKNAMGVPLEKALAFLALVESIEWTPPSNWVTVQPDAEPELTAVSVRVTDELMARGRNVASFASEFGAGDLRFEDLQLGVSVSLWLGKALESKESDARLLEVLTRLEGYSRATAKQEAESIALALALRSYSKKRSFGALGQSVDAYMARYMSPEGKSRTTIEAGQLVGLSDRMVVKLTSILNFQLEKADVAAPALATALRRIEAYCPATVSELNQNEELKDILGEGLGVESAISWARHLRQAPKLAVESVGPSGAALKMVQVAADRTAGWKETLLDISMQDQATVGCSQVSRVLGLLAVRHRIIQTKEAVVSVLDEHPDVRWLDKSEGWFCLGDSSTSAAAQCARTAMAADPSLSEDGVLRYLLLNDAWLHADGRPLGVVLPPASVFKDMCKGWRKAGAPEAQAAKA